MADMENEERIEDAAAEAAETADETVQAGLMACRLRLRQAITASGL